VDHQSVTIQPVSAGRTLEEGSPSFGWRAYWGNALLVEIVLLLFPGALALGSTWVGAAIGLAIAALLALPVALCYVPGVRTDTCVGNRVWSAGRTAC